MNNLVKISTPGKFETRGMQVVVEAYEGDKFFHIINYPWEYEGDSVLPVSKDFCKRHGLPDRCIGTKIWTRAKNFGNTFKVPSNTLAELYE